MFARSMEQCWKLRTSGWSARADMIFNRRRDPTVCAIWLRRAVRPPVAPLSAHSARLVHRALTIRGSAAALFRLATIQQGALCDGQTILEAGCGAGRFTEVLLQISGAHVTSVDMSEAVVANAENFPASERHRIAQADIRHLPFVPRSFDYVLCLGVVQHTPSPEETIHALWGQVKPGGWLVFDHYTWDLSRLTRVAQLWRRVFKRLPAEQKLPAVERMVDLLLPVHRRLRRYGRIVSRISPVLSFYHLYPDLSSELQREWAILDTHDTLTDHYKHHRSGRRIHQLLEALGGEEIWVEKGGNGVEARMRRPDV